jgi:hypothetical protein
LFRVLWICCPHYSIGQRQNLHALMAASGVPFCHLVRLDNRMRR